MSIEKFILNSKPVSLAKGYDVLIWVDDDNDLVCAGFTEHGIQQLREAVGGHYDDESSVVICVHPQEFAAIFDKETKIGIVNHDRSAVTEMSKKALH